MTSRDKFMGLNMHFEILGIYVTLWNKFRDFESLRIYMAHQNKFRDRLCTLLLTYLLVRNVFKYFFRKTPERCLMSDSYQEK